ncbi:MAG: hypothetical protein OIF40_16550, partial [Mangrovicoccus sp.]|nr:hypothetical protein [Mangrovicoccus sp.]
FWRAPAQNAEILAYLEAGGSFSDLCPAPGDSLPMAEHCPLCVLAQLALLPEHASAPKDPGYC